MTLADYTFDEKEIVNPTMTEEEFVAWVGERRAEWVDGRVVILPPDSYANALLNSWLNSFFQIYIEQKQLGVLLGPLFTIRLATQKRRRVPDILFVATDRMHLIRHAHLEGAPDMAIEIVAPESQSRDWRDKYLEYEKAGVREYWIIDPLSERMELYAMVDGSFKQVEEQDGKLNSTVLAGLYIKPIWLWQKPMFKVTAALAELRISI